MLQEAVNACLTPASELLAKVDELANGGKVVTVCARAGTAALEDVLDEGGMADFLIRHVLDEEATLCVDTSLLELLVGEASETIVEQVKFDPLLVQSQVLRRLSESVPDSNRC